MLGNNEDSFHTGWFVESLFTQILVVLVIRTRLTPFWRSRPSRQLGAAIVAALAAAVLIVISCYPRGRLDAKRRGGNGRQRHGYRGRGGEFVFFLGLFGVFRAAVRPGCDLRGGRQRQR